MTGTQWREGANTPVRAHIPRTKICLVLDTLYAYLHLHRLTEYSVHVQYVCVRLEHQSYRLHLCAHSTHKVVVSGKGLSDCLTPPSPQVSTISMNPAKFKRSQGAPKTDKKTGPAKEPSKTAEPTTTAKPVVAKTTEPAVSTETKEPPRPSKVIQLVRASKLRHVEGVMSHRSTIIDKLPSLNTTVPGDCNSLHVRKGTN